MTRFYSLSVDPYELTYVGEHWFYPKNYSRYQYQIFHVTLLVDSPHHIVFYNLWPQIWPMRPKQKCQNPITQELNAKFDMQISWSILHTICFMTFDLQGQAVLKLDSKRRIFQHAFWQKDKFELFTSD